MALIDPMLLVPSYDVPTGVIMPMPRKPPVATAILPATENKMVIEHS